MSATPWTPELQLHTSGDRCRLSLVGVTYGNGASLQDASNDLLTRLFDIATAFRGGRFRPVSELGWPPKAVMDFLWEIGEIVERGGDLRARVFGLPQPRSASD